MKNITKFACGVALALTVTQSEAQDTVLAQQLNIALTGYVQGDMTETRSRAERVKITTKDVLGAMGGTSRAKLVVLTPQSYEGPTMIVMRDTVDRERIETDVSDAFAGETIASAETASTDRRGNVRGTEYAIDRFTFAGETASFEVQGFTTAILGFRGSYKSEVNGVGFLSTPPAEEEEAEPADAAVLRGTISTSGGTVETIDTGGEEEEDV